MPRTPRRNRPAFAPLALAGALALMSAAPAAAQQVSFADWKHQRFSLFGGNAWQPEGSALSVRSDGTVSLLWTALPAAAQSAATARWDWQVDEGVPATDLTRKGGDDRNLALYTIYLPAAQVAAAEGKGVRALLENPEVRVVIYVWGGAHDRGALLDSPYLGARGKTVVLRPSGSGRHAERVDLRADTARAFGQRDLALVGLAGSADSDDTDTRIRARIGNLRLTP